LDGGVFCPEFVIKKIGDCECNKPKSSVMGSLFIGNQPIYKEEIQKIKRTGAGVIFNLQTAREREEDMKWHDGVSEVEDIALKQGLSY